MSRPLRRLRLEGSPEERGRAHGAAFAAEIRAYTEERVRLATNGSWSGRAATRDDVLGLAEAMLPAHRAFSPDLYAEMAAMAHAAGISAAEAVIVGGFTDFVDAVRARAGDAPEEDDCTAILVPDARSGGAGWLAQTWDMHDSATEHVVLLDVRADDGPPALVFTTVGCVAQIGMNAAGLAVGINNLAATDGRVGVTWPFVVREALRRATTEAALAAIVEADLAGGHNYLILDADGAGANVEAMPTFRAVEPLADRPLVHANHALHREVVRREAARAEELHQSSLDRQELGLALLAEGEVTRERLEAWTREPTAICRRSSAPFHIESSGAVLMRPRTRELWAVWGVPADGSYERFEVR